MSERLRAIADHHGAAEDVRVVPVDRADVVSPELGPGPRPNIHDAIDELKIQRRLGRTVASATHRDVPLSDGEVIPAGPS
ncbi:NADH dehydrogenase FAD-containing subunit [Streptomyces sp. LBL]|uniref:hypothetical protein n=1 Tax=Streptomyces sp. LBL TaxID=2940562 RepID=UPI002476AD12|nr:hypothetical protein [Streptomyces sp. LBL]MDH6629074.1 NADH dehydrogenase FAD-containing subunit [Streptomyces sp. LBL]